MAYTAERVAQLINGSLTGNGKLKITSLCIDSRAVYVPDEILFFALTGERHNGHRFIGELYKMGVRSFVISDPNIRPTDYPDAALIKVDNCLQALQKLAGEHRLQFHYPVIGISGSNGKTIVKEWLHQILQDDYSVVRSPRSYNSQVGVPLSVWNMSADHNLAIFEAGISQTGEMERLEQIIQPDLGIITHIGVAHIQNFENREQLILEKIKLLDSCEKLVYCRDEEKLEKAIVENIGEHVKHFHWSRKQPAFVRIMRQVINEQGCLVVYRHKKTDYKLQIPFTDQASVDNAITCCVTALALKISPEKIGERIEQLEPVAMRLEIKEGFGNSTLINDYYNSDLASLEIALDLMNRQHDRQSKTLILSDIYQSGYTDKRLYRSVSRLIKRKKVDRLIGIGERISACAGAFEMDASFYPNTQSFLDQMDRSLFQNQIILLKGARNFRFENISDALQFKGHRTVLEVDLNAMVHNLNYFRSLLQPQTKLMVMVKAFSYGSGSLEIAKLLQYHRVDYLAVAIADEGVELRNAGIQTPIIVMNPEVHSFNTMIEYHLEPEIYDLSILAQFRQSLQHAMVRNYPIHIKLDTGMHRMGFMQNDLPELIAQIRNQEQFHIASVFSHLAGADEEQHDEFTAGQIDRFTRWSNQICSQFSYPILRHLLNSAGIERFNHAQFDMVRLGLGLYGISPVHQQQLQNVSSLKTTISQIKTIPRENTVGYGRKGILRKDTRIGIIPIGYADGFNRKLSNGAGHVLVNGKTCPVVGNICMDMSMIDLSNVSASVGDPVIIFGDQLPVTRLAAQLDTIPYEILTTISRRVKRIYLQE